MVKKNIVKSGIQSFKRPAINFNTIIPELKKQKDKTKVNIRYTLIEPFAFAHIHWDEKISEIVYEVEEPVLDEKEINYQRELTSAMKDMINFEEIVGKGTDNLLDYIDRMFKMLAVEFGMDLSFENYQKIFYYLARDFIGFNRVEPLLRDYYVEDIECNGADAKIYIVHRVYQNMQTNVIFKETEELASFTEKLAQRSGKYISYANPILDSSLPDGSRVNATYTQDVTSRGPTFTIRKFTKTPWTPPQLLEFRTLSPEMLAYLWLLIEHHMNILIAGGTASGKTTLLNAVAFFISPESRVVSIEDTRELNLPRENWLPAVARGATGAKSSGEITLFELLKASMRQRPDYIIVGEVRGKEAFVLFQGMASGHSSISTLHADSVDTVIKRLETPPISLSPSLLNVLDCVCIMTHAIVDKQETRKLREIVEIVNVTDKGIALTNTPYVWKPREDGFYFKRQSKIFEKISERYGKSMQELELEFRRRTLLLYKMQQQKFFDFKKVQLVINEYYKNPAPVMRKFGIGI